MEGRLGSGVEDEADGLGVGAASEAAVAAGHPCTRARSIVVRARPAPACGLVNPNFFIFEARVVGLRPSKAAVPSGP